MPETAIGLFPDVGAAWPLSRMPDSIGMYLGLTGRSIGQADAYALGLLTHCIPASRFEEIKAALADTWPVDTVLDDLQVDPGPGELAPYAAHIAYCFSAPTVEEIVARLGWLAARRAPGRRAYRRSHCALADLAQGHAAAHSRCARARSAPDAQRRLQARLPFPRRPRFLRGRARRADRQGRQAAVAAGATWRKSPTRWSRIISSPWAPMSLRCRRGRRCRRRACNQGCGTGCSG